MSEEMVVRHCSPTLAGLKTGNMFCCPFSDDKEITELLQRLNRIFVKKGVRVVPLRRKDNRALIYIFRPSCLKKDLCDHRAKEILHKLGYSCKNPEHCVMHLIKRLDECKDFPHEIGLFLGYPPEDVSGFIENKADGCKYAGFWKVYGDAAAAKKLFAKFDKCTKVYCAQWAKGSSIDKLTVATRTAGTAA